MCNVHVLYWSCTLYLKSTIYLYIRGACVLIIETFTDSASELCMCGYSVISCIVRGSRKKKKLSEGIDCM